MRRELSFSTRLAHDAGGMTLVSDIGGFDVTHARLSAAAKTITPDQVAELLAIKLANMHKSQMPIGPYHWARSEPLAALMCAGMITAEEADGAWRKGWKRARITDFGERVLLHVAEDAMIAQGRMPIPLS
jgi:hypothetical protein